MKLTKLVFKLLMLSLLCNAVPLFSMERLNKIRRQMVTKQGSTKNIFEAVEQRKLDYVKYWLEQGIDINTKDAKGNTALILAAQLGALDIVKYLVEKKADIDATNNKGETALMVARMAHRNHLEIVQYLVKHGANKEIKSNGGRTILMLAVQQHITDVMKYLIEQGANIETRDSTGWTPLIHAARGHPSAPDMFLDTVQYLVKRGADKEATDNRGRRALMIAAEYDMLNIVKYLVEQEVDKEAKDKEGLTALMYAARKDHFDIVRYLIDAGANLETVDYSGKTVLALAFQQDKKSMMQFLIDRGANLEVLVNGSTILMLTAQQGDLDMVKYLVERGADIQAFNGNADILHQLISAIGKTTSYWTKGSVPDDERQFIAKLEDVLKYLVDKKANLEGKDKDGLTPFLLTLRYGQQDLAAYLAKHGANVDARYSDGDTALINAAKKGNVDELAWIIKLGADIEAKNKDGNTPLLEAVRNNRIEAVKFLVEHGADKDAKTQYGETALIEASSPRFNGSAIMKYLLQQGAFMSPSDVQYMFAEGLRRHDPILLQILEDRGLSLDIKRAQRFLDEALQNSNFALLQMLEDKGFNADRLNPAGFDPNKVNADGQTILINTLSEEEPKPKAIEFLIKRGVNPYQEDNSGSNAFDYAQDNPEMLALLNRTTHTAPAKKAIVAEPESDTKKAIRRLQHIKRAMQPEIPKADAVVPKPIAAKTPTFSGLTQTEAHWKFFGPEVEKKYGKVLDEPLVKRALAREKEAIAQGNYVFYRSEPGKYRVYEYFIEELYRLVNLYSGKNEFVWNRFFKDAAKEQTINEYIDTMQSRAHKKGPEFNVLLSANISLFGNVRNSGSCTWDYFLKNNEATGHVELSNMFKRIFDKYGFDEKYIIQLLNLNQDDWEESATLQQIIIPKNIVDNVVMFATHGYCFPWQDQVDKGQADSCWDDNAISVDGNSYPKKGRYTCISSIIDKYRDGRIAIDDAFQVRILMNAVYGLNPESGIKIYQYTRFPEKKLLHFKKLVTKITDEMFGQWLKELIESKGVPYGAKDEPLGDTLKYLGKGRPKSKL